MAKKKIVMNTEKGILLKKRSNFFQVELSSFLFKKKERRHGRAACGPPIAGGMLLC
jgi:hypothetical protein